MRAVSKSLIRFGVLTGIAFAVLPSHAATTWTVTGTGEPTAIGSTNCTVNSCPTLRDAINSSASGDTIVFDNALDGQTIALTLFSNNLGCVVTAPTVCDPNNPPNPPGTTLSTEFGPSAFFLTGNKALTVNATQNGLTRGITLSAANSTGCAAGACFRLFDVDSGSQLDLIGLTLRNGVARGGASLYGGGALGAGGAIFNQGTLTLSRCTLTNNSAIGATTPTTPGGNGGGGVGGNPDNASNGGGPNGGEYGFSGNGSPGGFGGGGGAVSPSSGIAGSGGFGGGGGFSYNPTTTASYAGPGGFGGGGGGNAASVPFGIPGGFGGGNGSVAQSGGAGGGMGGAIFNDAGTVSLVNSTLSANTASGGGGFDSGNGSGFGGAIFNYMGNLALDFVTLDGNTVIPGNGVQSYSPPDSADGGAIYSLGDNTAVCQSGGNVCATTSAALTMNNSIAANSSGSTNDVMVNAINGGTSTSSGVGNLVMTQSGFSGTVVSSANPQLNALIGGGGIWNVMVPRAGSPVINAVACDATATDQRGIARPQPQGGQCDIGSVEYDGDVIFVDGFEN